MECPLSENRDPGSEVNFSTPDVLTHPNPARPPIDPIPFAMVSASVLPHTHGIRLQKRFGRVGAREAQKKFPVTPPPPKWPMGDDWPYQIGDRFQTCPLELGQWLAGLHVLMEVL
eukprot:1151165-Pelagomonas_calceolata.AAC.5